MVRLFLSLYKPMVTYPVWPDPVPGGWFRPEPARLNNSFVVVCGPSLIVAAASLMFWIKSHYFWVYFSPEPAHFTRGSGLIQVQDLESRGSDLFFFKNIFVKWKINTFLSTFASCGKIRYLVCLAIFKCNGSTKHLLFIWSALRVGANWNAAIPARWVLNYRYTRCLWFILSQVIAFQRWQANPRNLNADGKINSSYPSSSPFAPSSCSLSVSSLSRRDVAGSRKQSDTSH